MRRLSVVLSHPTSGAVFSWVLFMGAWQTASSVVETSFIPAPIEVVELLWGELQGTTVGPYTVWQSFGASLRRLAIAFGIAFLLGVAIGIAMGALKIIENALLDLVVVGLAVPTLVWALLTGIWLGLGDAAPIASAVLASLPFVIFNTSAGVREVPRDLIAMAKVFGVKRSRTIRGVVFPSLSPFLFAALRYGVSTGWLALVIAEVFSSTNGVGWMIQFWRDANRPQGVFAYAILFVVFALLLERAVFVALANRVFRWRAQPASKASGGPTGQGTQPTLAQ